MGVLGGLVLLGESTGLRGCGCSCCVVPLPVLCLARGQPILRVRNFLVCRVWCGKDFYVK